MPAPGTSGSARSGPSGLSSRMSGFECSRRLGAIARIVRCLYPALTRPESPSLRKGSAIATTNGFFVQTNHCSRGKNGTKPGSRASQQCVGFSRGSKCREYSVRSWSMSCCLRASQACFLHAWCIHTMARATATIGTTAIITTNMITGNMTTAGSQGGAQ